MNRQRSAADRIRLVLAIVPWIIDNPGATIDEIARRFGQRPDTILKTLEMVSLVGVPPYSPDALIEVTIDEGRVRIGFADYFSRPLQLSTGQALALLSSADALRRIEGADPDGSLNSALEKLAEATGVRPEQQLDIHLGDASPEHLDEIRSAARDGNEVTITYFNHSKNESTERTIAPRRVRSAGGSWYVDAYCRTAEDERTFRLDRILGVTAAPVLGAPVPPAPDPAPAGQVFRSHGELPTVTLVLGAEHHWVRDSIPIVGLHERGTDAIEVTLAVASMAFLERLLLQLGPGAQVVRSDIPDVDGRVADAARRILTRYGQ